MAWVRVGYLSVGESVELLNEPESMITDALDWLDKETVFNEIELLSDLGKSGPLATSDQKMKIVVQV